MQNQPATMAAVWDYGDCFTSRLDGAEAPKHFKAQFAALSPERRLFTSSMRGARWPIRKRKVKMTADLAATGVAAQELKQFVERVERLEEEKKALSGDIREVYAEMKGRGLDVRAVREIVKIRKQDNSERKEMEALLELYMSALNMS
jgi:uncharacterized protein (UPF0335 family)